MVFNPAGKEDQLMTDSKIIYRYLHGGRGEVTLVSPRTYKAHTYRFFKPKNERDFPEDTIFVSVIHENRPMYIGMLRGSEFKRTQHSSFNEDTEAMKGARYIVKMANRQDVVDAKSMLLYHSGHCCYCERKLHGAVSLREGIGKRCLKYYNSSLKEVPWDGN